jgi:hypothetical protein
MAAGMTTERIARNRNVRDNFAMARRRAKFFDVLKEQQESEKLVCIYHGDDGHDKFDVGFVESLTPTTLTLLSVSPRGEFDGRVVMHLDDLNRIEMDDRYSRKIELLHQYRGSVFKTEDHVNPSARADDLHSQLSRAVEEQQVACVEDIKGNAVTGFIAEVGDDFVMIEALTQLGEPDGKSVINLEEVARVQIGARDQQIRGFLYRYNYELRKLLEF